jgi:hypothetical protein
MSSVQVLSVSHQPCDTHAQRPARNSLVDRRRRPSSSWISQVWTARKPDSEYPAGFAPGTRACVGNACMDVVPVKLTRLETSDSPSHMATFAAQIKDKFLGLVDHVVAGCGLAGGGRAGAHQAAHRGTVQVLIFCLASYYIITKSFSCPTHACIHLVQYRALRIWLLMSNDNFVAGFPPGPLLQRVEVENLTCQMDHTLVSMPPTPKDS